jgi:hypothetical protein
MGGFLQGLKNLLKQLGINFTCQNMAVQGASGLDGRSYKDNIIHED